MTHHDRDGGGLPPESNRERRRLKRLAERMTEEERDSDAVLSACRDTRRIVRETRKVFRAGVYDNLVNIFRLLCLAQIDPAICKEANRRAKHLGIRRTEATSTALFFVKVFSPRTLKPATASQQAKALRGAALLSIPPDKLLAKLKEKGGMTALAQHFHESNGRQSAEKTPPKDMGGFKPIDPLSLFWTDSARKVWRKAAKKQLRVKLTVIPDSNGGGRILKARLYSNRKERADEQR
ncbi:MAG: hypothetical protein ACM359_04595 [Bacillota bacterium]